MIEEMKRVFTSWHEGGFRVDISRHDEGAGPVYTIESPPHYSGFSPAGSWGSEDKVKETVKRLLQENGHHCSEKCTSWEQV